MGGALCPVNARLRPRLLFVLLLDGGLCITFSAAVCLLFRWYHMACIFAYIPTEACVHICVFFFVCV
eukprot:NODE_5075_length_533_cov_67.121901_g3744_i0.p1 GENE.NODE_5075_length_533_cov_67.121901_g3744_i0~~NODE_5075_length_533_cov_67.121901_g3744_i0.p1  ORF type:complete len:77 (-),score=15.15 NODE_5075_length_533_cov_67.121901_g3744_i0:301-501(-)